jgi:hypothetical protein
MNAPQGLYAELKGDIAALAEPLFDFSEKCLRKHGNFLPHAAVLLEDGTVELLMSAPDSPGGLANSAQVLPLLHEDLRAMARAKPLSAVAVAENVTVTREGEASTDAVKVLFEHRRGLTIALYLPFGKRFLRGYSFGQTFSISAQAEVNAWNAA